MAVSVFYFIVLVMLRKESIFIFLLCTWMIYVRNNETRRYPNFTSSSSQQVSTAWVFEGVLLDSEAFEDGEAPPSGNWSSVLEYDYYRETCPDAESIIRAKVHQLFKINPAVAPALLRLAFHDCFIQGCDASLLLDAVEGMDSEKNSPPNESLKGFDVIDMIKSELEQVCPAVVSCADILVLVGREAVLLTGGPFYPLNTGRRDSTASFSDSATNDLPPPNADLSQTLASFSSRGFDERETVSLLGAHSIGSFHCKFFQNRLHNFSGTNKPDPTLDPEFLNQLRSTCHKSYSSTSPAPAPAPSFENLFSSSPDDQGMAMTYEATGAGFGAAYYRSLLHGKGILHADQQLVVEEETGLWVRKYASEASLYQRDFAQAMMKLSNLHVLTAPSGQIRLNCSRVV